MNPAIDKMAQVLCSTYYLQQHRDFQQYFDIQQSHECTEIVYQWLQWQLRSADEELLQQLINLLTDRFGNYLQQCSKELQGC